MHFRNHIFILFLALAGSTAGNPWVSELRAQEEASIRGTVTGKAGPLEGGYVGAHATGKTFTTYVMTDAAGQFTFRGLAPGSYGVFTRIPGFRTVRTDGINVEAGKEAAVDFQVEPETDFLKLVEQATNSELTESFPLSPAQKEALAYRCGDCHGAYYIAKSRFTREDWAMIVAKMDDQGSITPAGDMGPPPRMSRPSARPPSVEHPGSDDESIARVLWQFRGPDSPDFPIQFQPRATGKLTRVIVTEYQIPRLGATPRTVVIDPRGDYVWYSDWRANYLGRVNIQTGEIKEYPIPGVKFRPPGLQRLRWDPMGNLLAGQIWAGRAIRFDVNTERVTGIWDTPLEWARAGGVGICRSGPDGPIRYLITDALVRRQGWIIDPETDQRTEVALRWGGPVSDCDRGRSYNWEGARAKRAIIYRDPETGTIREFAILSPWARPQNAVGDPVRNVGWSVPAVIDRVVKADLNTGEVTEFPLPSHGKTILNIDIETSSDPPVLWFVNQRQGRIVRFQEYTE